MSTEYPLVDVSQTPRQAGGGGGGWDAKATLRIGISGAEGAAALAYHATVPPGSGRVRHASRASDEILIYLQGSGLASLGGVQTRVRAGHCQFVPRGHAHAFTNDSDSEGAVIVGFYPSASRLSETGFTLAGPEAESSIAASTQPRCALVHLDAVAPAGMNKADGWFITDFRLPIGRHTGSNTTLFRARFMPDAVHKKHRHDNCAEIYFIISGGGVAGAGADRVRVHAGHFHYVPRGVEHWLSNTNAREPIEVVGIYIGAGNVAETGYVYMGDVHPEDVNVA